MPAPPGFGGGGFSGGFGGGGGGGPPQRIPFTATILLTKAPPFLHTFRAVRDWMYPCGSVRNAIFHPRKSSNNEDEELPSTAKVTLLITMSHPDGACKFLGAFKRFTSRLDDRYNQIQAYMVPASPDMPLPPPFMDEDSQQQLGEKLWQNFVTLESSAETNDKPKDTQKLDVTKVAAAAGGGNYDADEDPLNAPQVLEAVKQFRRKLDQTQGFQKKRRMEMVTQKLAEMRPRVQAMMIEEKTRGPVTQQLRAPPPPPTMMMPSGGPPPSSSMMGGPPPPLPGAPPPLPLGGLPVPPVVAAGGGLDSGKRKHSNLPAWMTQQQTAAAATTTGEDEQEAPPSKKTKTDEMYPTNFPPLPPSTHLMLREFLSQKIKEYLGEEEATLIDFLHAHILQGKATSELLKELQMVLEEESATFLEQLWVKVRELQQQQ
jgi:hypothetical protein